MRGNYGAESRRGEKYIYTYDNDGNVVKEEFYGITEDGKEYLERLAEYTYDENRLKSGKMVDFTYNNYSITDEYSFKCDEKGRIVQIDIRCGDEIDSKTGEVALNGKSDCATEKIFFSYGNFYDYIINNSGN